MKILNRINTLTKESINGRRYYCCPDGNKVVSVTTILSETKSDKTKEALTKWRSFVGNDKADQIVKHSCDVGTLLHSKIENYFLGNNITTGTNHIHRLADNMFEIMKKEGLGQITDCWGNEISLFFPKVYAGTTDCVGIVNNKPTIIDFKNSRKIKTIEQIEDYTIQLAAYAEAFEQNYNIEINSGLILMVTQDLQFTNFYFDSTDFKKLKLKWWDKVEEFYIR